MSPCTDQTESYMLINLNTVLVQHSLLLSCFMLYYASHEPSSSSTETGRGQRSSHNHFFFFCSGTNREGGLPLWPRAWKVDLFCFIALAVSVNCGSLTTTQGRSGDWLANNYVPVEMAAPGSYGWVESLRENWKKKRNHISALESFWKET